MTALLGEIKEIFKSIIQVLLSGNLATELFHMNFYLHLLFWPRIIINCFESYLEYRQFHVINEDRPVSKYMEGHMTKEDMQKTRSYSNDRAFFRLVKYQISFFIEFITMFFIYSWSWVYSIDLSKKLFGPSDSVAMATIIQGIITTLLILPYDLICSIINTFCIEQKHGFNRQTPCFFIKDQIKSFFLQLCLGSLMAFVLVKTIEYTQPNFILATGFVFFIGIILILTIMPNYILPLFDKFVYLPDSWPIKQGVVEMMKKHNFPLGEVKVQISSNRSSHSNAYFIGLLTKKIVIFESFLHKQISQAKESGLDVKEFENEHKDSDVEKEKVNTHFTNDEILGVLEHEVGHWYHSHLAKNLVITMAIFLLTLYLAKIVIEDDKLYQSLMLPSSQVIGILFASSYLFSPLLEIIQVFMVLFSRHNEYQADEFAMKNGKGLPLISALQKMTVQNKSYPYNDHLYSAYHHTHPTVEDRINAIKSGMKQD